MGAESAAPGTARVPKDGKPARARPRIAGLDGWRGLACLAVLVVHVSGHFSPGVMGVYKINQLAQALILFFALSGFLLYLPFARAILADPATARMPNTRVFALHRVLRVFPGYLVIFLISCFGLRAVFLVNAAITPPGSTQGTGMMTDPLQLLANLTLLHSYIPRFFQTGLNPSWSLSLELVFYATLPVMGYLGLAVRRRSGISPALLACIGPVVLLVIGLVGKGLALVLRHHYGIHETSLAEFGPNWVAVVNRSFLGSADTFTFGMLAAVLFVMISEGTMGGHIVVRMRWYCGAAMLLVAALSVLLIAIHNTYFITGVSLFFGMLVLFTVLPIARGERSKFAERLDWKPFKYTGEISLSIYLWHFPVLLTLGRMGWMGGDTVGGLMRNLALVLVVTLVLATLSYRFVERPALKLAKRYRPS